MSKNLLINYNGEPSYWITIRDSFNDFTEVFKSRVNKTYDKICIVTDTNVSKLYLEEINDLCESLCNDVISFEFEAGEEQKNLSTIEKLYEHLIIHHFTRKSLLVALGGGVVGDMTGFAASTYLRGIDFIQIPTTLLSQVDSSVGGKTGVDFLKYKNMVGAFYMPKLVYMNVSTLKSLDDYNFACGMGEVIKSALIQDKDFYNWLKANYNAINTRHFELLENIVYSCCKIKGHVVEIDPTEQNIRAYLNFGHTIGHAIEKLSNFTLGHGQCVALGMCSAAYLSEKLGYLDSDEVSDIISTIAKFELPTSIDHLNVDDILFATKSDKKMSGQKIKFTVLQNIGEASSYLDFSDEDLKEGISKVLNND